jgi:hypothetical protein
MQDDIRPADPQPTPSAVPSANRHVWRTAIVVLGVVAVLGVLLAFAPVRGFASQLLGIFRVQKIATVSITSEDLKQMSDSLGKGDSHISLKELGDVWVNGKPDFAGAQEPTLTTLSAAQGKVDFPLLVPAGMVGTQSVLVQEGVNVQFKLHVDKVNELLRYYGADKFFSQGIDGKTFTVNMPPTVYIAYGKDKLGFSDSNQDMMSDTGQSAAQPDATSQDVFLAQTRGPQVTVPDGVNPLELRDVLLGLPFLPESLRTQLAGVSDWQSTLLIPNIQGSTRDITVNGHPGVVITEPQDPDVPASERSAFAVVMWQQDGVIRAVGSATEAKSLKIAESLAR